MKSTQLQATGFSGSQFTFQAPSRNGQAVVAFVDEDGFVQNMVRLPVTRDGDGRELQAVTIAGKGGQPDQHLFHFVDDEIPLGLQEFVVKVGKRPAVPARYVRGVHMDSELQPLADDLVLDLLKDTSVGQFLRLVSLDDDEGGELDAEGDSETEAQAEDAA
jgi:hypothetical protein